jgi:hypothetical protein
MRLPIYFLTCLVIVVASAVVLAACMFPVFIVHAMTVLK